MPTRSDNRMLPKSVSAPGACRWDECNPCVLCAASCRSRVPEALNIAAPERNSAVWPAPPNRLSTSSAANDVVGARKPATVTPVSSHVMIQ